MLLPNLVISHLPYHIKNMLHQLEKCYNDREYNFKLLSHLCAKNPTLRKVHTERYKAIILILYVFIYFTDFRTGQIGKLNPKTGEFKHMSIKTIAHHAGLGLRRTIRALRDLKITMYYESKRRVEKISDLIYRSLNSIKKLSDKIFHHLGMKVTTLKKIRRFKAQEHNEKFSKNEFYYDEFKFIRKNVKENISQSQLKNFTEKIPRNILDIIKKSFKF